MKRLFPLFFLIAFPAVYATAQQIAVVNGAGSTSVYYTLDEAISGADAGSTVYIPGGGFKISDGTKINKKLTLIGIGHKPNTDNADGNTTISGNVNFTAGSDGSAIMGVYMPNDINIAQDGKVKNILVRYCNANSIQVKNDSCTGIFVNQNYLRSSSSFGGSNATVTNNIMHSISNLTGGVVNNNIMNDLSYQGYHVYEKYSINSVKNSTVKDNVCRYGSRDCSGTFFENNQEGDLKSFFVAANGVTPDSDFHFSDTFEGNTDCGVYAGTGFSDDCLPPLPRIVSKSIAEQTDAQGKLKVQVTVKTR
ncbi:MAG: hypothetical protein MJY66_00200 [Bacteroidaceae bacterium]|nr:hypothetical protein [Bacteroidaceae bacterium]